MNAGKRIILPLAIAVLCVVLLVVWLQTKGPDDPEQVALVDGAAITKNELERAVRKTRDSYAVQGLFPDDTQIEDLKQEVLERLIETELLWQQSVREGITVADEAVAAELAEMKRQFINEAIFNNLMENAKMTMPELLSLIKKDLAITALVKQKVADSITLSAEESEEYYRSNTGHFEEPEKIKASHLFISLEEDASDADRQKAQASIESLKVRLDAGEAFELLAKEASDCPSAEDGGDLGFIARGTMDDVFEETAFSMQLHEISPIVKSSSGYHIIKATDRQQARLIPFDEVKEDIEQYLLDRKIHKGVMDYLEGLRQKADIRRHL
jgi:peptidyl-prolyl cis-trans isomerase C